MKKTPVKQAIEQIVRYLEDVRDNDIPLDLAMVTIGNDFLYEYEEVERIEIRDAFEHGRLSPVLEAKTPEEYYKLRYDNDSNKRAGN